MNETPDGIRGGLIVAALVAGLASCRHPQETRRAAPQEHFLCLAVSAKATVAQLMRVSGVMLGVRDAGARRPQLELLHHPAASRTAFIASSCLAVVALGNEEETNDVARIAHGLGIATISTSPGLDVAGDLEVVDVSPNVRNRARSAARFARAREWAMPIVLSSTRDQDAVAQFVEEFGGERVVPVSSADAARAALEADGASVLIIFPSAEREAVSEAMRALAQGASEVPVLFVSRESAQTVSGVAAFVVSNEPLPVAGGAFDEQYRSAFHRTTTSDAVLGYDAGLLVARALWADGPVARLGVDVVRSTQRQLALGDRLVVPRAVYEIRALDTGAIVGTY